MDLLHCEVKILKKALFALVSITVFGLSSCFILLYVAGSLGLALAQGLELVKELYYLFLEDAFAEVESLLKERKNLLGN